MALCADEIDRQTGKVVMVSCDMSLPALWARCHVAFLESCVERYVCRWCVCACVSPVMAHPLLRPLCSQMRERWSRICSQGCGRAEGGERCRMPAYTNSETLYRMRSTNKMGAFCWVWRQSRNVFLPTWVSRLQWVASTLLLLFSKFMQVNDIPFSFFHLWTMWLHSLDDAFF